MRRSPLPLLIPVLLALSACAGNVSASSPKTSPTPGRAFRNGASGQLVKITGTTLILSGTAGDTTVVYDSTTRISRTSTASVADIVPGVCIFATGLKDATGAVTATSVRVTPSSNGSCAQGAPAGGGGGAGGGLFGGGGFATPRPGRPTPPANFAIAAGLVTAVTGTQVTLTALTGGSSTVSVPTTVLVSKTSAATAADLQIGECITAGGQRDSAGTVHAGSLTIRPPSASGTCGGFGRGGFGGGGGFFGGGASN